MENRKTNEKLAVDKLLEFIVTVKFPEVIRMKLSRTQLLNLLKEYLKSVDAKEDPVLVLEEWEPELRQPRLIGDHMVKLSTYSSEMSIEFIPLWSFLERAAELRNRNLVSETTRRIKELTPHEFEKILSDIFSGVPWARNVNVGKMSRDGGVDFEGEYVDLESGLTMKLLGQAKHWKAKVGSEPIRTFLGSMLMRAESHKIVGVYVATGGFNEGAIRALKGSPYQIFYFDLAALAEMMIRHRIGIRVMKMEGYALEDAFWDELAEG